MGIHTGVRLYSWRKPVYNNNNELYGYYLLICDLHVFLCYNDTNEEIDTVIAFNSEVY